MTKLKHWHNAKRWQQASAFLNDPIFKELLEVIEEIAKPNAVGMSQICKGKTAKDAAFDVASVAFQSAGMQAAIDRIRSLCAEPVEAPKQQPQQQPYDHINPDYLENRA